MVSWLSDTGQEGREIRLAAARQTFLAQSEIQLSEQKAANEFFDKEYPELFTVDKSFFGLIDEESISEFAEKSRLSVTNVQKVLEYGKEDLDEIVTPKDPNKKDLLKLLPENAEDLAVENQAYPALKDLIDAYEELSNDPETLDDRKYIYEQFTRLINGYDNAGIKGDYKLNFLEAISNKLLPTAYYFESAKLHATELRKQTAGKAGISKIDLVKGRYDEYKNGVELSINQNVPQEPGSLERNKELTGKEPLADLLLEEEKALLKDVSKIDTSDPMKFIAEQLEGIPQDDLDDLLKNIENGNLTDSETLEIGNNITVRRLDGIVVINKAINGRNTEINYLFEKKYIYSVAISDTSNGTAVYSYYDRNEKSPIKYDIFHSRTHDENFYYFQKVVSIDTKREKIRFVLYKLKNESYDYPRDMTKDDIEFLNMVNEDGNDEGANSSPRLENLIDGLNRYFPKKDDSVEFEELSSTTPSTQKPESKESITEEKQPQLIDMLSDGEKALIKKFNDLDLNSKKDLIESAIGEVPEDVVERLERIVTGKEKINEREDLTLHANGKYKIQVYRIGDSHFIKIKDDKDSQLMDINYHKNELTELKIKERGSSKSTLLIYNKRTNSLEMMEGPSKHPMNNETITLKTTTINLSKNTYELEVKLRNESKNEHIVPLNTLLDSQSIALFDKLPKPEEDLDLMNHSIFSSNPEDGVGDERKPIGQTSEESKLQEIENLSDQCKQIISIVETDKRFQSSEGILREIEAKDIDEINKALKRVQSGQSIIINEKYTVTRDIPLSMPSVSFNDEKSGLIVEVIVPMFSQENLDIRKLLYVKLSKDNETIKAEYDESGYSLTDIKNHWNYPEEILYRKMGPFYWNEDKTVINKPKLMKALEIKNVLTENDNAQKIEGEKRTLKLEESLSDEEKILLQEFKRIKLSLEEVVGREYHWDEVVPTLSKIRDGEITHEDTYPIVIGKEGEKHPISITFNQSHIFVNRYHESTGIAYIMQYSIDGLVLVKMSLEKRSTENDGKEIISHKLNYDYDLKELVITEDPSKNPKDGSKIDRKFTTIKDDKFKISANNNFERILIQDYSVFEDASLRDYTITREPEENIQEFEETEKKILTLTEALTKEEKDSLETINNCNFESPSLLIESIIGEIPDETKGLLEKIMNNEEELDDERPKWILDEQEKAVYVRRRNKELQISISGQTHSDIFTLSYKDKELTEVEASYMITSYRKLKYIPHEDTIYIGTVDHDADIMKKDVVIDLKDKTFTMYIQENEDAKYHMSQKSSPIGEDSISLVSNLMQQVNQHSTRQDKITLGDLSFLKNNGPLKEVIAEKNEENKPSTLSFEEVLTPTHQQLLKDLLNVRADNAFELLQKLVGDEEGRGVIVSTLYGHIIKGRNAEFNTRDGSRILIVEAEDRSSERIVKILRDDQNSISMRLEVPQESLDEKHIMIKNITVFDKSDADSQASYDPNTNAVTLRTTHNDNTSIEVVISDHNTYTIQTRNNDGTEPKIVQGETEIEYEYRPAIPYDVLADEYLINENIKKLGSEFKRVDNIHEFLAQLMANDISQLNIDKKSILEKYRSEEKDSKQTFVQINENTVIYKDDENNTTTEFEITNKYREKATEIKIKKHTIKTNDQDNRTHKNLRHNLVITFDKDDEQVQQVKYNHPQGLGTKDQSFLIARKTNSAELVISDNNSILQSNLQELFEMPERVSNNKAVMQLALDPGLDIDMLKIIGEGETRDVVTPLTIDKEEFLKLLNSGRTTSHDGPYSYVISDGKFHVFEQGIPQIKTIYEVNNNDLELEEVTTKDDDKNITKVFDKNGRLVTLQFSTEDHDVYRLGVLGQNLNVEKLDRSNTTNRSTSSTIDIDQIDSVIGIKEHLFREQPAKRREQEKVIMELKQRFIENTSYEDRDIHLKSVLAGSRFSFQEKTNIWYDAEIDKYHFTIEEDDEKPFISLSKQDMISLLSNPNSEVEIVFDKEDGIFELEDQWNVEQNPEILTAIIPVLENELIPNEAYYNKYIRPVQDQILQIYLDRREAGLTGAISNRINLTILYGFTSEMNKKASLAITASPEGQEQYLLLIYGDDNKISQTIALDMSKIPGEESIQSISANIAETYISKSNAQASPAAQIKVERAKNNYIRFTSTIDGEDQEILIEDNKLDLYLNVAKGEIEIDRNELLRMEDETNGKEEEEIISKAMLELLAPFTEILEIDAENIILDAYGRNVPSDERLQMICNKYGYSYDKIFSQENEKLMESIILYFKIVDMAEEKLENKAVAEAEEILDTIKSQGNALNESIVSELLQSDIINSSNYQGFVQAFQVRGDTVIASVINKYFEPKL